MSTEAEHGHNTSKSKSKSKKSQENRSVCHALVGGNTCIHISLMQVDIKVLQYVHIHCQTIAFNRLAVVKHFRDGESRFSWKCIFLLNGTGLGRDFQARSRIVDNDETSGRPKLKGEVLIHIMAWGFASCALLSARFYKKSTLYY